jgi:hypothetical protein
LNRLVSYKFFDTEDMHHVIEVDLFLFYNTSTENVRCPSDENRRRVGPAGRRGDGRAAILVSGDRRSPGPVFDSELVLNGRSGCHSEVEFERYCTVLYCRIICFHHHFGLQCQ